MKVLEDILSKMLCTFVLCLHLCTESLAQDVTNEGGDTTIPISTAKAFDQLIANASSSAVTQNHTNGEIGFKRNFAKVKIGGKITIGPKFNNVSCSSCHIGAGRGQPVFGRTGSQTVVKVSASQAKSPQTGAPTPVTNFGPQLLDHSIGTLKPDVNIELLWDYLEGTYNDDTAYQLRRPRLLIKTRDGKKLPSSVLTSIRRTPAVYGTGLLDAISDDTIKALSDPNDLDHDGISGRPNLVWDIASKTKKLGRFGFKAAAPSALQQIATAYSVDMGVTNPLIRNKDKVADIPARILNATTFYTKTLAVPAARNQESPTVIQGKALFISLNCSGCHTMTLTTGTSAISELSNQTIHPFTDLLLHDMGHGIADGRPEFKATGSEWRTTPLWGIGLTSSVLGSRQESYLHDGRARTLSEAILWHGGEAAQPTAGFKNLSSTDRDALIAFLKSL